MLRPRWLGLLVVLIGIIVSFTLLGLWQLSVARDDAAKQAVAQAPRQPVVALSALLQPHSGFPAVASNRRVSAVGHYDPSGQVLVPDRRLDGATGSWVVTPWWWTRPAPGYPSSAVSCGAPAPLLPPRRGW